MEIVQSFKLIIEKMIMKIYFIFIFLLNSVAWFIRLKLFGKQVQQIDK